MEGEKVQLLITKAAEARGGSYSPYSHFQVGAALLTRDGRVYTGCNIENAAYGPSICAERTAIFKAVSEGEREFTAICIMGGAEGREPEGYAYPCGVCRQVMREFCEPADFQVIVAKNNREYEIYRLEELLPKSFGPENLSK